MVKRAVLAAALVMGLWATPGAAQQPRFPVLGAGGLTCEAWLQSYQSALRGRPEILHASALGFVYGFLAGVSWTGFHPTTGERYRPLRDWPSHETVLGWVVHYCTDNPSKTVMAAAQDIVIGQHRVDVD